jgi:hypothetical protein
MGTDMWFWSAAEFVIGEWFIILFYPELMCSFAKNAG